MRIVLCSQFARGRVTSEIKPVCGADGVTYQSACLAICQHIAVARNGPCKARDATSFAPARAGGDIDTAGAVVPTKVDVFTMTRCAADWYLLSDTASCMIGPTSRLTAFVSGNLFPAQPRPAKLVHEQGHAES